MSAKSAASTQRRRQAMRRSGDSSIPPLAKEINRKGRCPQKVGVYGRTSMYYSTTATTDRRWDHTLTNQDAL